MFNKKNICCLIITYNPDYQIIKLIESIQQQVQKIVIVDNNSNKQSLEILSKIVDNKFIELIRNSTNVGIGKALNIGFHKAIIDRYEYVLTFDQDTQPYDNIVDIIREVYCKFPEKEKIGAIGVNYIYTNLIKQYQNNISEIYKVKNVLITSGCLVPVTIFKEIKGFREDMFIDHVDEEFCLRLGKYNKFVLISSKVGMIHEAGNVKRINRLFINFVSSNHNSIRRFYMARNQVLLVKEYFFQNPIFIIKSIFFFLIEITQMTLVDDDKTTKMLATVKGLIEGLMYSSQKKKYYEFN